jgi:hypothetical protein
MRRTTSNEPYGIEDTGWLCIKRRGSAWARKRRGLPTRAQDAMPMLPSVLPEPRFRPGGAGPCHAGISRK